MIIVGAGCAGLSCGRTLADAGEHPLVLEKARGVGGRSATRRFEGQPVDHGILFYHGSHPDFLDALDRVEDAIPIETWPETVVGDGQPCLPRAFRAHERRIAFVEGVTAFPKSLARGIEVHLETRVRSISLGKDRFELETDKGEIFDTESLVLTLPVEQVRALVASLPDSAELRSARALIAMLATEPCLTVIAGFPIDAPVPEWDVLYPKENDVLLLASHDSRKRTERRFHIFVFQCSARFSRQHLDDDSSIWIREVLGHAAAFLGSWVEEPTFTHGHRWRFGRANASALARPLLVTFPGGQKLGLAGEFFDSTLGVEAAFLSGRALARRMLGH